MMSVDENSLIDELVWVFFGVTSSGLFVFRDEAREYLYIPGAKKDRLVSIK